MMKRTSYILLTNIQTVRNSMTPKSTNIMTVIGQSIHERSYGNSFMISLKRFCHSKQFSSSPPSTEQKILITEEEKTHLLKWLEICRFEGMRVPKIITEAQYLELSKTKDEKMRGKYLNYLYKKEAACENDVRRKEKKKIIIQQRREERNAIFQTDHIMYGLWKNALFSKTNKRHLLDLYHHKLITAMTFGQPLVIDIGFDDHIKGREITSFAEQLAMSISMNRSSLEPFNLTLCNANFDSESFKRFAKFMPSVLDSSFPLNIHKENYLEIFPKEKLIYLTPNAKEEVKQFDHDAIYIIGGIVDIGTKKPLTFTKAKKEHIKMRKLPVDKHLIFKKAKVFSMPVMLAILASVAKDGDWRKAFEFIPNRYIDDRCNVKFDINTDPWNKKRINY